MKKRLIILFLLIAIIIIIIIGREYKKDDYEVELYIGKSFAIVISEEETVNAEYLQQVKDGKIKKDFPYFDMMRDDALTNLIEYMKKNNYEIVPGEYKMNQAWGFNDGLFFNGYGKKIGHVFKFSKTGNGSVDTR